MVAPFVAAQQPQPSFSLAPAPGPPNCTEPAYVPESGGSANPYQYGCVAMNFGLSTGFGSAIAILGDNATSGNLSEAFGPNGCTFEPTSNTGIVIVRNLVDTTLTQPSQNETYALIDSGVLP